MSARTSNGKGGTVDRNTSAYPDFNLSNEQGQFISSSSRRLVRQGDGPTGPVFHCDHQWHPAYYRHPTWENRKAEAHTRKVNLGVRTGRTGGVDVRTYNVEARHGSHDAVQVTGLHDGPGYWGLHHMCCCLSVLSLIIRSAWKGTSCA